MEVGTIFAVSSTSPDVSANREPGQPPSPLRARQAL